MGPSRAWFAFACAALLVSAKISAEEATIGCDATNLLAERLAPESVDVVGQLALLTDGAIAREGAEWDAAPALVLQGQRSFVTFDLGEPREVRAVYVQADANDTYRVDGSLESDPTSFRALIEIPNVVTSQGHGLRGRALELREPVRVRYLRIGEARGDGAFSLSEVAAYCRTPKPFPEALRAAGEPAPIPAAPTPPTPPNASSGMRNGLLSIAALLGVLGLFFAVRPQKTERVRPTRRAASRELPLHVLFVASGAAALIYEVVWLHLLRLVIGASSLSVGIVLASFMGGMFLGSLLFARWVPRARDPLRTYAFLELGIAAFGVLMPLSLPLLRSLYVGLVGYGALGIALRALLAALLLLPPTALMGATLPAIARRYAPGRRGMARLGSLYAANTLGAVLGSLLSAFYLLAVWDVWVATWCAVGLNLCVCAGALRLQGDAEPAAPQRVMPRRKLASSQRAEAWWVYVAAGASGLTALGAQVVWTRLLTLLFGATVYAFAIILGVFLACLGIGSALAAYLLRRGWDARRGLLLSQVGLIPALWLSGYLLANVVPYASPSPSTPVAVLHWLHVLRAVDVILPAAILWGMAFPFALSAAALSHGDPARSSGRVYAANTLGAIIGALVASFWLIPFYGTQRAQQALVLIAALAAAALSYELRGVRAAKSKSAPYRSYVVWAVALGAIFAAYLPGLSQVFLAHGRYLWAADPRDQFLYTSEGAASTVAVHVAPDGTRHFHVSGRVEASNNPADLRLERLLGHLSALAHPKPESVLVVGLGAGITAGSLALHPEVKRVVICEIEPRVAGAANYFTRENYDILRDPRTELVFDDARHFLATTRERFDVITSDPIHPWVRGNSVLFSREYYQIVRSRLKPGGIATQWVPLYETSEEAIQIQMRTFTDAFPQGSVWNSAVTGRGYDVVLLGRTEPLVLDLAAIQARIIGSARVQRSLGEAKVGSAVDLLGTYATNASDMRAWLGGVPVNRDFSLKLEYISGLALNSSQADPIYTNMVRGRTFPEHLFRGPAHLVDPLRNRLR
ncbi:MAG: fused MFS/spermidine synthase [Myxococcota bacterium]